MIIDTAERLKTTKEYYFSIKLQEVRDLISKGKDIINIAIGNPDMAPSQSTVDELNKQSNIPENHGYQAYRSIPELRKAISEWMQQTYGVSLNPENEILPLIGSKEGITHISLAFLNPGDEVLVPELSYPAYGAVAEMVGGKAVKYPMIEHKGYKPDFAAIEEKDLSKVKLMWINYPNMPTGAPADKKVFEEIIAFAGRKNILICHDNPYSLVLNEGKPLSLLSLPGAKEVAVELNSMSKSHNMAGWRIGWLAGDSNYLDAVLKIKSNVDSGMFKPMQLAAVEAFKNPESWHISRNDEYKKRRESVYRILDILGCTYDKAQTGMFIWAKVNPALDNSEKLADYLLYKKNIFVTPGKVYGEKGNKYIRISLCVKQDILNKVISRLQNFDIKEV
jgi:LL-diaminopimelate aminotransferase